MALPIPETTRALARRKGLTCRFVATMVDRHGVTSTATRPYRVEHPSGRGYRGAFATLEALETRLNGFPDDPLTPP